MSGCDQKKGLLGRCRKAMMHPGDHDNGKVTWPRAGLDLRIYQKALAVKEQMVAEQRRLDELTARHERGEL